MPNVTASYGKNFNFIEFFFIFSYIIYDYSYLNCCTNYVLCLFNIHLWSVNMPNMAAGYGTFSDLIAFLGILIHYYMFETLQLHQSFTNSASR